MASQRLGLVGLSTVGAAGKMRWSQVCWKVGPYPAVLSRGGISVAEVEFERPDYRPILHHSLESFKFDKFIAISVFGPSVVDVVKAGVGEGRRKTVPEGIFLPTRACGAVWGSRPVPYVTASSRGTGCL